MNAMIRDATPDDVARILAITNEAIAHTTANWSLSPTTLEERLEWFHAHVAHGYPIIVAVRADRVVGFAAYGEFRPKPGYRFTVEHSVYVDAECRGHGIGALLLRALIARAEAGGVHVMIGGIEANNAASLHLHERFGFERTGHLREVGNKFDRWLDLVFMQRILTSSH
jgi:phosphinothricin acetyltransferase